MTADDLHLRASDDDREAFAARLRDAHADGRLPVDEFQQRIDALYDAKTFAEIEPLVRDLPGTRDRPGPAAAETRPQPGPSPEPTCARHHRVMRVLWTIWACVLCADLIIWGALSLTSERFVLFWPIWLIVPGAVLLAIQVAHQRSSAHVH